MVVVLGGALMLMGPPIQVSQDAHRSAIADEQRLTTRENAEADAAAGKVVEAIVQAERPRQKAAEEELLAMAATRRHEEETRQAAEDKARAEAAAARRREDEEKARTEAAASRRREEEARQAVLENVRVEMLREMAEAQARAVEQEIAKRQEAENAPGTVKEQARTAAESKPKSDAEVRKQAERAEAGLNLSEQDRKGVQVALNSLGYKIPTATGYFGPRTRAMITAWQKTQGFSETGYLTEAQLATLRQQAAAALAKHN